jgi:hypothetical protein
MKMYKTPHKNKLIILKLINLHLQTLTNLANIILKSNNLKKLTQLFNQFTKRTNHKRKYKSIKKAKIM